MIDDWFAALTILACEEDVVRSISTEDVINSFSQCSSRLRAYLIYRLSHYTAVINAHCAGTPPQFYALQFWLFER